MLVASGNRAPSEYSLVIAADITDRCSNISEEKVDKFINDAIQERTKAASIDSQKTRTRSLMNELPVIGSLFIQKGFWDRQGKHRKSLATKCMAETSLTSFDVLKTILEKDQRFFRHSFIRNRFGQC